MDRPRRRAALLTAVALAVSGCTRPEDAATRPDTLPVTTGDTTAVGGTDPTSTTSSTTPASPTTSSPGTPTTPPTTVGSTSPVTTAPTTEPAPLPDLTLIFDGVVPFRFGDRDVDVVTGLVDLLGPPTRDELREYPVADEGRFLDESGEQSFIARFGRTTCFADGLCVQFGAGAPDALILTGWRLDDSAPPDLVTENGIAIGSTWAEHPDTITLDPTDSCYQIGYADSGGIDVVLLSGDGVFAVPSPDGSGVTPADVDPASVTVIEMRAGDHPVFVFEDC